MDTINVKPLYQTIIDDILEDVQEMVSTGNINYDIPFCTEKSLCEKYNVSRITAKHAIKELEASGVLYRKRGVGSFISKPSDSARTVPLVISRPKAYALLVPFDITKGGVFQAIESATGVFARSNCHFTFHISELNLHREEALLNQVLAQNADGVVYYPWSSTLPIDILNRFVEQRKPVVILDKTCEYPHISSIVCDNYKGGYLLTEHLVSYGHTNICYLSRFTADELPSVHDRYTGYMDCLRDNQIGAEPRFVHWDRQQHPRYPMLKHIINNLHLEGVTAVECENDEVAFNVYMCCRSLSIRVPDEMNITGFDNIGWATTGSASITTIDQNFSQIGEAIAEVVMQEPYAPRQLVIPVNLVPRTSTGKIV